MPPDERLTASNVTPNVHSFIRPCFVLLQSSESSQHTPCIFVHLLSGLGGLILLGNRYPAHAVTDGLTKHASHSNARLEQTVPICLFRSPLHLKAWTFMLSILPAPSFHQTVKSFSYDPFIFLCQIFWRRGSPFSTISYCEGRTQKLQEEDREAELPLEV